MDRLQRSAPRPFVLRSERHSVSPTKYANEIQISSSPPLHTNVTHLENNLNVSVSICPDSMEFHRWRDRRGGRGVAGRGFSGGRVPPVDAKEPRACLFAVPTVGGHAPRSLYSLR